MPRQRPLDRMAVAHLADLATAIVSRASPGRTDSTGQPMLQVRAALVADLQAALAQVYPEGERSLDLNRALERRIEYLPL